jgi:membrane-bound lytic murein transglycosylase D
MYKSTEKACEYLQSNYNRFGDWLLALAAYNGGPGNVSKAIARSGGKKTFWEIKPYLPKETQNYVPKFIATVFLMSFYPPNNESANKLEAHEMVVPVNVCCPIDMKYISAVINISEYEQLEWNSVYKDGIIPQFVNNKTVILPYAKAMQLCQFHDSIYLISANSFNPENFIKYETYTNIHKVKKGETIAQIANNYNVYVSDIKRWNRLKSNKLKSGSSIKIIKSKEVILPVNKSGNSEFFFYITTFESQTVSDICSKFPEFDTKKICQVNQIESTQTPLGKGKIIKLYTKFN